MNKDIRRARISEALMRLRERGKVRESLAVRAAYIAQMIRKGIACR